MCSHQLSAPLAASQSVEIESPAWFRDAMKSTWTEDTVDVDGCPIHYMAWGDKQASGVVLVHGSAANAYWWSHIAPILATERRVVAVDLSGHGDSGHRSSYSFTQWGADVLGAADHAFPDAAPAFVGHSIGGHVVAHASKLQPNRVGSIVLCEMPIPELDSPETDSPDPRSPSASFGRGQYRSIAEAVERFRPVPPQDSWLSYVAEHIVANSVTPRAGQWGWKFDSNLFGPVPRLADFPDLAVFGAVTCPIGVLRGEDGHELARDMAMLEHALGRQVFPVDIPDAGHNPMLDQPLALAVALRCMLNEYTAPDGALEPSPTPA